MKMNTNRQRYLRVFDQESRIASRALVLVFSIAVCINSTLKAGLNLKGDAELLRLTAMAHKDNKERIITWQGSAQIEVLYDDGGPMLSQKVTVPFLFDIKQNAVRWDWIPQQHLVREQGQLVPAHPESLEAKNAMTKGEAYYSYAPRITTKDNKRLSTLVIWPRTRARKFSQVDCFNPMWYQSGHMTNCTDDLVGRLMSLYNKANSRGFSFDVMVKRESDIVVLEISNDVLLNHHEFDLSKGGNIVKYYGKDNNITELREWTYEEKNGVWILKTFTFDIQYNLPQSHGITHRAKKVTFVENTLNKPIPPSEFSLEKLGVKVGDQVTDQIKGLSYFYKGTDELLLENENALLGENQDNQAETSTQETGVAEGVQINDKQKLSHTVIPEQPVLGQVQQREQSPHTIYFVLSLVIFLIIGLASFMILRNYKKIGAKA